MLPNIKWFPGELFALMGEDQLRSILNEIEKEDPELVKRVLTRIPTDSSSSMSNIFLTGIRFLTWYPIITQKSP